MNSTILVNQKKEIIIRKGFKILMFLTTLAVCLFVFSNVAFAAIDPVDAVNNMNDYIALFFQAIGVMAIMVGIFLLALGFFSHDPSQKITGGVAMGAGALLAGVTYVVNAVIGG